MIKLNTKPAHVFAQYLKISTRFADFVNVILFHGNDIVKPDKLYVSDTDSSIVLSYKDVIESVGKRRDNIMLAELEQKPVFIAIEHQQKNDYSMCKRILTYDDITYNQQFQLCDKNVRQYLHPIPVITVVIYTGEQRWIQPRRLIDRMFIPECIRDKVNDWNGYIMDMKDIDVAKLRCKDNRQLVTAVQRLYKWNKDISSIADIVLTKEVAIVVSTIIGEKELIGYIEQMDEKEDINMCTAIREFREEGIMLGKEQGIELGKEQGMKLGIIATIKMILNQRLGSISEEVMTQLNQSNEEQLQILTLNLNNVHSEKDILKILL